MKNKWLDEHFPFNSEQKRNYVYKSLEHFLNNIWTLLQYINWITISHLTVGSIFAIKKQMRLLD
jgi:hypothetical protein